MIAFENQKREERINGSSDPRKQNSASKMQSSPFKMQNSPSKMQALESKLRGKKYLLPVVFSIVFFSIYVLLNVSLLNVSNSYSCNQGYMLQDDLTAPFPTLTRTGDGNWMSNVFSDVVVLYFNLAELESSGLKFYLSMLSKFFSVPSTGRESILHVFVSGISSEPDDSHESIKKLTAPRGHSILQLEIGNRRKYSMLANAAYIFSARIKLGKGTKVVLLDSSQTGPFLPTYWKATGYHFWTDAYTRFLSPTVGIVAGTISCNEANGILTPEFDHGPIVLGPQVVETIVSMNMSYFRTSHLFNFLHIPGHEVFTLHRDPVFMDPKKSKNILLDWKAFGNGFLGCEKHMMETDEEPSCDWKNIEARYPSLSHLPKNEAAEKFEHHNPPEGLNCAQICDYKTYRDRYFDLHKFSLAEARLHFIKYGSFEGRDCRPSIVFGKKSNPFYYDFHPFETLFLSVSDKAYEKAIDMYSKWSMNIPTEYFRISVTMRNRVLIVYAYYEKTQQYRDNLEYFLQKTVYREPASSLNDYVIVVNGDSNISFARCDNLFVIHRENSCFDFGSWGIGLRLRTTKHKYFIFLNGSVRGPFLPSYFHSDWTSAFTVSLTNETPIVGLSVNCPDGKGRLLPHIMTMFFVLSRMSLELVLNASLFDCADSYEEAVEREGLLSTILFQNGFNLRTTQAKYWNVNWPAVYHQFRVSPKDVVSKVNNRGFTTCEGIDLDVFYENGWYSGMTAHPIEFGFFKTTRNVASPLLERLTLNELSNLASKDAELEKRKTALLLSHILDADGAPRVLLQMATAMVANGYRVIMASPKNGTLYSLMESVGVEALITRMDSWQDLHSMLKQFSPAVVFLNTIVWFPLIKSIPKFRPTFPKYVWMIHENEIVVELYRPGGFWYGLEFPSIQYDLTSVIHTVDKVVWVSDACRFLWSQHDHGHFLTFRGFVNVTDVFHRSGLSAVANFSDINEIKDAVKHARTRNRTGEIIVTATGTFSKRKRQLMLVQALSILKSKHPLLRLIVIGKPSQVGEPGDYAYYKEMEEQIERLGLTSDVALVPFSHNNLIELLRSDIHVSVSTHESFPLNTLEAMALGVPVAVTRAGGSEEQIFSPGIDGYLFPILDGPEVAAEHLEKIISLGKDELAAVGEAGQSNVLRYFSSITAKERVHNLLENVMEQSIEIDHGRKLHNICAIIDAQECSVPETEIIILQLKLQKHHNWKLIVALSTYYNVEGILSTLSRLADNRIHILKYTGATIHDLMLRVCGTDSNLGITFKCPLEGETIVFDELDSNSGQKKIGFTTISLRRAWEKRLELSALFE